MSKVRVVNNDFEAAMKEFKKIASETRRIRKKYEFYLKPGVRKKEEEKAARKRRRF